jgi:hypothetical protein
MPDLIRHPGGDWMPASAAMTILRYLIAGAIIKEANGAMISDTLRLFGRGLKGRGDCSWYCGKPGGFAISLDKPVHLEPNFLRWI